MKIWTSSLLISCIFFFSACNTCEDIACTTPPAQFQFEFRDATTLENLFSSEQINQNDLSVQDQNSGRMIQYNLQEENGRKLLVINDIGWQTETVRANFALEGATLFNLYVDAEVISEDCCSFTRFNEVELTGASFEIEQATGIYLVDLDL